MRSLLNRFTAGLLSVVLVTTGFPLVVQAELIGTQSAINLDRDLSRSSDIDATLARDDVRDQLMRFGVNPERVSERLANLTDSEIATLNQKLNELPAGGDALAVIGIVFLVLLILELVGVIDIFKRM